MNKEKGEVPIIVIIQIVIILFLIATLVTGFQALLAGVAKIPGVPDWLGNLIPDFLAWIVEQFQNLASWALQGKFVKIGVIELAQQAGWKTVRDLANIFLVLGLIIIAVGIILGIREYEAKKTLPILIIIALLINFTPVICGLIVDFSNKIMDWLLEGAIPSEILWQKIGAAKINFTKSIKAVFVFTLFVIIAAVTYFLYFLLFLIRYIYLLICVIFSPIAFASKVFPPSERIQRFFPSFLHWNEWWRKFLEWCAIGIFGAFFLLVANNLMIGLYTGEIEGESPGIIGGIILYFFPILLLLVGFFATLEIAQGVANLITSNVGKVATGGRVIAKVGRRVGEQVGRAVPERARKWAERQKVAPQWFPFRKGKTKLGKLGRAIASPITYPTTWVRRKVGTALTLPRETEKREKEKGEREAEKRDVIGNLATLRKRISKSEKLGIMGKMIEKGQTKDVLDEAIVGTGDALKEFEILSAYREAWRMKDKKSQEAIERAFVKTIGGEEFEKGRVRAAGWGYIPGEGKEEAKIEEKKKIDKENKEKGYTSYIQKIIGETKTMEEIKQLEKEWWKEDDLMRAVQVFWGGHQLRSGAEEFGRTFVEDYMSHIETRLKEIQKKSPVQAEKEYKKEVYRNPEKARYLETTGAQEAGFGSMYALAPEGVKRKYRNIGEILAEAPSKKGRQTTLEEFERK